MSKQQEFLLLLKDPDAYNVKMASLAIVKDYSYVSCVHVDEMGEDDRIFSMGVGRDYRMWKLRLDIDCVDVLPLNGLEASLEFTVRQHVFNTSNFKVSDYIYEGQKIIVCFRTTL